MISHRQFSPTEFLILKESITTNIVKIKKEYHKLTKLEKMIGGKNDTHELRTKVYVSDLFESPNPQSQNKIPDDSFHMILITLNEFFV